MLGYIYATEKLEKEIDLLVEQIKKLESLGIMDVAQSIQELIDSKYEQLDKIEKMFAHEEFEKESYDYSYNDNPTRMSDLA